MCVLLTTITLYLMLGICALGIGLAVAQYDLYVHEPWPMALVAIALGAAGMWGAYWVEVAIIRAVYAQGHEVTGPGLALIAGATEEVVKVVAVAVIAMFIRRYFNEPLDGLVYGSFAGLGAALEESIDVLRHLPHLTHLPAQEPIRLAGHLVMGGIGGFGMGLLVTRSRRAPLAIAATLGVAIALHFAWDVVALGPEANRHRPYNGSQAMLAVLLMLLGMLVYRRLAAAGARLTRAHLQVCDLRTRACPPF